VPTYVQHPVQRKQQKSEVLNLPMDTNLKVSRKWKYLTSVCMKTTMSAVSWDKSTRGVTATG
jgi:hypothetical protein